MIWSCVSEVGVASQPKPVALVSPIIDPGMRPLGVSRPPKDTEDDADKRGATPFDL